MKKHKRTILVSMPTGIATLLSDLYKNDVHARLTHELGRVLLLPIYRAIISPLGRKLAKDE